MDNFDFKKYLAEGKLFEERKDIGTPEELKSFLYSRQSDIVGWVKEAIENHGEENISWEEDIKQWIADDAREITPVKFQLTYNDTTYDGYDEYMFESVYEEFVQSTYNKFFGKTAEYDENQLELAEGKLFEENDEPFESKKYVKIDNSEYYVDENGNVKLSLNFPYKFNRSDKYNAPREEYIDKNNWKEKVNPNFPIMKVINNVPTADYEFIEYPSGDKELLVKTNIEDLKKYEDGNYTLK